MIKFVDLINIRQVLFAGITLYSIRPTADC